MESNNKYKYAVFAGGCFWCMVPPFNGIDGIVNVETGYTGGSKETATYMEVCSGTTGHYEAVKVTYDPEIISYKELLDIFWRNIDPTDTGGQFYDRGQQYETVIFYFDDEQKELAEESIAHLQSLGRFSKPIATKVLKACDFYTAEEYHQDYYKKNPEHYMAYKTGSGREAYIKRMWNDETY